MSKMLTNAINWFEIPATDFDRAVKFYSAIGFEVRAGEFNGMPHGFFSAGEAGVTGALVKGNGEPGGAGPLLYLNAKSETEMRRIVEIVLGNGGKVELPIIAIAPQGWMAIIHDSEGNRVGLHAAALE